MKDISLEMSLWCSRCSEWTQETFRQKRGLRYNRNAIAKAAGWEIRSGRLICSNCIEKEKKQ